MGSKLGMALQNADADNAHIRADIKFFQYFTPADFQKIRNLLKKHVINDLFWPQMSIFSMSIHRIEIIIIRLLVLIALLLASDASDKCYVSDSREYVRICANAICITNIDIWPSLVKTLYKVQIQKA